jgi:tetratricopeptide (TPR) repeat protein
MSYPGNPSLAPDVQQRVLDTFGQTLDLVNEGSRQEALLGCDFVLRMDPQFDAARRLQERLRTSAGAVVDTDDLRRAVDPSAPPVSVVPADLFADLDGLGLELPDLPAPATADLHAELQALLAQRRFQDVMALAEQERAAVTADPVLLGIVQETQSRMEADPYVRKFLDSARAALAAGNRDEVGRILEKVRALDSSHPEIAELEAARAQAAEPARGSGLDAFDLDFEGASGSGFGSALEEASMPGFDAGLYGDAGKAAAAEADPRIRSLLDEGRRAFEGGDLQGAIDAWSRIFLIDIDHAEASRLIEHARKLKAEGERQVEEIFHDGLGKVETGDAEAARQAFQRVLELQPSHFQAREYLQQLEAGKMPTLTAPKAPREAPREALAGAPESLLLGGDLDLPTDELKEEILVPPDPSEAGGRTAERRAARPSRPRERRPGKLFVVVGTAVLLLVLAGGWFVWQNWGQLFPNSQTDAGAVAAVADPIARAKALRQSGKAASAISLLRRLPPSDPQYQQAQELIKQWGGAETSAPEATPLTTAEPEVPAAPAVSPERLAALEAARQAFGEGSYLLASQILDQAAATGKLEAADADLQARAKQQLAPLRAQIDLFQQHEWEFAVRDLWTLHEKDPGNKDVSRMLIDSYYNLGVRDLQRTDAVKASDNFQEALKLAPGDAALRRNLQFAQTYQERPKDLLYKIYVKYLAYR